MEQIETHIEHVQEEINHHASPGTPGSGGHGDGHGGDHSGGGGGSWIGKAALSAAFLAALAAICGLLAGYHSEEQMLTQIKASDQWAFYQAKGIKAAVLTGKTETLAAIGKEINPKDQAKIEKYNKEQEEISREAKELEAESHIHGRKHTVLAKGVTLFQVAIAVVAVAVLSRRKAFWYVSLGFGLIGLIFLVQGLMPAAHHVAEAAAAPVAEMATHGH